MADPVKATATQNFVPVKEIRDGVVILKNNSICAVLLASSLNFALKSGDEQPETYFSPEKSKKDIGEKEKGKAPSSLQDVADKAKPKDPEKKSTKVDEKQKGDPAQTDENAEADTDAKAEVGEETASPAPSDADIETSYQAGIKAFGRGQRRDAAPAKHKSHADLEAAWQRGWDTGSEQDDG